MRSTCTGYRFSLSNLYLERREWAARAPSNVENFVFHLPLLSPFTIFPEERRRLGSVKCRKLRFPFATALAFHYLSRRKEAARLCQMSKTSFSICHCSRLSLSFQKKGGGSALSNVENFVFHLPLLSPFTIFPEERRRLGSVKCRKLRFPFATALAFHYLCTLKHWSILQ